MPDQTTIPDLTGKTTTEAFDVLTNAGLTPGASTDAASDTIPAGQIIRTDPATGANIAPGDRVNVVVSTGAAATALVPDVTGITQAAGESRLRGARLAVRVTPVSHATVPSGIVITSTPAAGSRVANGSTVQIDVSTGPGQVVVPSVTGLTRFAAEAALRSAGLVHGTLTQDSSSAVPAGGVIDQSPAAGNAAPAGSRVDLRVSKGIKKSWSEWIAPIAFIPLAVILVVGTVFGIIRADGALLAGLADEKKARGLITFFIAVTTVGIAVMLALSTVVLKDSPENDKRFDRGKQVLTILIGVLGTIVGFYFGSANAQGTQLPTTPAASLTITTETLPGAAVKTRYDEALTASGGRVPLTWSATGLPEGLTLDAATGRLSGTPAAAGSATVAVSVTDRSDPPQKSPMKEFSLEVKDVK